MPPPPLPIAARSFISVVRATFQPLLTSPRRWLSGTRTSVKKTSLKLAPPVIWRNGRISTPGARMSTTKPVRPLCLGRSGSVRAMISPMSLYWAPDVQTFWPLRIHSSPSRSARVCRLARSLPAPGSENSWHADDVAAVQLAEVRILRHVGAVGEDRRGDHAEADREVRLVRGVVLGLERVVGPLVGRRQAASAELLGPGDPAQPGVEALGSPLLGLGQPLELVLAGALLEHGDGVGALAPDELLLRFLLGRVGLEERGDLGLEVFDADHVGDGRRQSQGSRYGAGDVLGGAGATGPKKIKSVVAMTEVMATTPLTRCGWRRSVNSALVISGVKGGRTTSHHQCPATGSFHRRRHVRSVKRAARTTPVPNRVSVPPTPSASHELDGHPGEAGAAQHRRPDVDDRRRRGRHRRGPAACRPVRGRPRPRAGRGRRTGHGGTPTRRWSRRPSG